MIKGLHQFRIAKLLLVKLFLPAQLLCIFLLIKLIITCINNYNNKFFLKKSLFCILSIYSLEQSPSTHNIQPGESRDKLKSPSKITPGNPPFIENNNPFGFSDILKNYFKTQELLLPPQSIEKPNQQHRDQSTEFEDQKYESNENIFPKKKTRLREVLDCDTTLRSSYKSKTPVLKKFEGNDNIRAGSYSCSGVERKINYLREIDYQADNPENIRKVLKIPNGCLSIFMTETPRKSTKIKLSIIKKGSVTDNKSNLLAPSNKTGTMTEKKEFSTSIKSSQGKC